MVDASRRAVLTGAAGAGLLPLAAAAQPSAEPVWYGEYEAAKQRDGATIRLQMYRKDAAITR